MLQGGGRSIGGVPALRPGQLPGRAGGLGAGGGRLHHPLPRRRPGARGVLRVRPAGAPVLRIDAGRHLQVPRMPPSLLPAAHARCRRWCCCRCRVLVSCRSAVRLAAFFVHWKRAPGECPTASLHRPSCYNCGEGGHTAPECRREKPIAVRNERQPGYSERSVKASYYGYDDDYSGYNNGYATWIRTHVSALGNTHLPSICTQKTWPAELGGCASTGMAADRMAAVVPAPSHAMLVASQGTWRETARTNIAGPKTVVAAALQQVTAMAETGVKLNCLRGSMTGDDVFTHFNALVVVTLYV
jgi:Zinc knuckle